MLWFSGGSSSRKRLEAEPAAQGLAHHSVGRRRDQLRIGESFDMPCETPPTPCQFKVLLRLPLSRV